MDRLGKRRITRPLAWLMLYLLPISAGIALYLILSEVLIFLSPRGPAVVSYIRTISPLANLLLPGVNPYVPIVYGWVAIVIAVAIHEAAHGIVARSLGLRVKSAGVLFLLFIPVGAFVEVDEAELRETRVRNSLRVLAAGSGINFILAAACILLLFASISAMTPVVNGAAVTGVYKTSPAGQAGIRPGDFVVAIDGQPVNNLANYPFTPAVPVNVTIWRSGSTIVLPNVNVTEVIVENLQTHQNTTVATIGTQTVSYQGLQGILAYYLNAYKVSPVFYVIPPAFPAVADVIPFSDTLAGFYTGPLGPATPIVNNLLFWIFFINFNLSIFNNLPIYPMDGGQALERFVIGIGRGRISDEIARRITTVVTLLLFFTLFSVIAGPYLTAYV
jgi:membrane-associated protease RseP (regulator of RpoE activity)